MSQTVRAVFAALPLVVVIAGMLRLGWTASKAAAAGWLTAAATASAVYRLSLQQLSAANAKGITFAIYVVTIIWCASLLYNVVHAGGGIRAISETVSRLGGTPVSEALMLSWCFTGVMQGIGGFGVPVIVISPILVERGFRPATALVATLLGHSWSINFGSMATSYWAIQLVTGLPAKELAHEIALVASVPVVLSGLGIAYICDGMRGLRENWPVVAVVGPAMALVQWAVATGGVPEGGSIIAGSFGCIAVFLLCRLSGKVRRPTAERRAGGAARAPRASRASAPVLLAPYLGMVAMLVAAQVPAVKHAFRDVGWGLSYPGYTTPLGFAVRPEARYGWIGLASHPAPVLLTAGTLGVLVYLAKGVISPAGVARAWNESVRQCLPAVQSTTFLVMMALVMNDSGMTTDLAVVCSRLSGRLFPVLSPLLGGLGSFLSGSNASSNVLFGRFQVETARLLGVDPIALAAGQTIGASVGSFVTPSKIILGTTTLGLEGEEGRLLREALAYCLPVIAATGVLCMALA